MNFWSHFEALNDAFWESQEQHGSSFDVTHVKNFIPWIDISKEVLTASNRDHMPKLHPSED